MLADSLRAYVNRYGVAPGRRAVIATAGASAYTAAADLKAAGLEVTLVDVRPESECGRRIWTRLRSVGCEVLAGHTVLGSRGRKRVAGLLVAPTDAGSFRRAAPPRLRLRRLSAAAGRRPCISSRSRAGGSPSMRELDAFVPGASVQAERSAGACRGTYRLADLPGGRLGRRRRRGGRQGRAQLRGERDTGGVPPDAHSAGMRRVGQGARLRRPAERRHRQGHRPGRARGLPRRSSTSSATPRPAWRPTRARPPT